MKIIELKPLLKPIHASVSIPGSKSYTNRVLLIAAVGNSKVKIINPLISDDTEAMINCLRKLGIKVKVSDNMIKVGNNINHIKNLSYDLDANESGTTIRFLLALSAVIPGVKILHGKEGLNKRPIGDLVEGLRQLGAKIEYLDRKGYPPIKVLSSKLNSGTIKIKGNISSQYISAILMVAPLIGEVIIEVTGNQISKLYIVMTIGIMRQFGVKVQKKSDKKYLIPGNQKYETAEFVVEGDVSSASYFFALAALTKSEITIENINPNSKQADMKFIKILENIGNKITFGENRVTITGTGVKLVNIDMQDCPDQIQTISVLAAFAKGVSKISGISSLRVKETDRVFALRQELKKMGIKTSATKDVLTIHGGNPRSTTIDTYGDHRMAMSFAIAGAKLSGMKIVDPDVVNKTFPEFFEKLNLIGVKTKIVNSKNIILIGMRGSGKTTVAKLLSEKLNKQYVELDELIVKKVGLTIPKVVEKYGWDFFRDKESEVVQEVSLQTGKVISTGGGIVTRPENIDVLKKNGFFVLLNASAETLLKRVGDDLNRPFLTNGQNRKEEVGSLLQERKNLYEQAVDQVIETDHLNPDEVTDRIISRLRRANI